jgi:hypothetical protein
MSIIESVIPNKFCERDCKIFYERFKNERKLSDIGEEFKFKTTKNRTNRKFNFTRIKKYNIMILEGPINNLSLGNVTFNIARELIKRNELSAMGLPPCVNNAQLNAFDKASEEVKKEIVNKLLNFTKTFSSDEIGLKLWHINGSERRITKKTNTFLFL